MQLKENKKLIVSLFISFVVIASFTGIIGYVSTNISKDSINQLVGQQATTIAYSSLNKIDVLISEKISDLRKMGGESTIQNTLAQINQKEGGGNGDEVENRFVSNLLDEKIRIENQEKGYSIYENIVLRNQDGRVVAASGNFDERFFYDFNDGELIEELREQEIFLSDVYFDDEINDHVFEIWVLVFDARGNEIGSIHAVLGFQEIMETIDESKENSQFESTEFDLFYDDGHLLYSTTDRQEDYIISDFIFDSDEDSYQDIDREFEILDDEYDKILKGYGYEEPELSEKQWEEIEEELSPLDEQYEEILEEYEYEDISEKRAEYLEEQILMLDREYDMILQQYGFKVPTLSESEQYEFDEKIIEIESRYDDIYEKYDFDYTFGAKGFSIVESDQESETLYSYSRQKGHEDFEGFDWILVVHTDMNEILKEVNSQRDLILSITVTMTGVATVLGILFSRIFYKQSQKINENEKMSTIGHLSSNIAHDMRNPLGAIRSSSERIKDQNNGENQAITDEIDRINRSVKRMSHQVEGVLNYVRTTPLITDQYSVTEMLNYASESIDIPKNIKLVLPAEEIVIECDEEKLEITFVNLILNAVQAIGKMENGEIRIRIKEGKKDISVSFENNGPKIADEVKPRLFEPLFTTNLKGTGLGLSSCRNIVEQHGGKISVIQDPATFTVHIPKKQQYT